MSEEKQTCCGGQHPDHAEEISRINRIGGQIEGIKKMIEERRYCADILTQLRAVQSAAKSVESNILKRHLDACVREAFDNESPEEAKQKIDELINMFKRHE